MFLWWHDSRACLVPSLVLQGPKVNQLYGACYQPSLIDIKIRDVRYHHNTCAASSATEMIRYASYTFTSCILRRNERHSTRCTASSLWLHNRYTPIKCRTAIIDCKGVISYDVITNACPTFNGSYYISYEQWLWLHTRDLTTAHLLSNRL